MKNKKIAYEISSGNVFADLGLPNPEERLAKAQLASEINRAIAERGLNQSQAAKLLGISQPKVSALSTGKLAGFSIDRLFKLLNLLGQYIVITVSPDIKGCKATITLSPKDKEVLPSKNSQSEAISISKR
jgi:predicted XRE-type DNA-binding protein